MRKLLLVCIMAAAATMSKAQSTMTVHSTDDTTKSGVKLEEINKLTFAGDKMTVTMNNGAAAKTFDLNAFDKVTFDNTPVSIAGTTVEKSGIKFAYDGENISVTGLKKAAPVVVYNANGSVADSRKAWDGSRLSVASLPAGTYLLSVEGVAYKFLKK